MIDPRIRALLDQVPALPRDLPVTEERRRLHEVFGPLAPAERPAPTGVSVEEHVLEGPTGPLRARIHRPSGSPGGAGDGAVLLQLPGGGFRLGGIDSAAATAAVRAHAVPCRVVTVEHRLAPEHPFPAAVEDVHCALRWAAGLGGPLLLAGISAGANLAVVAALRARDEGGPRVAVLVLEVPALDPTLSSASVREHEEDALLPRATLERIWRDYVPPGVAPDHPWIAPAGADLSGLPPTLVVTAEHDPLRDEGEAFVERLRAAGAPAALHRTEGTVHGLQTTPLTEAGEAAHDRILAVLRAAAQGAGDPLTQPSPSS